MNFYFAFFTSIGIWLLEFYTFAMYVNTKSDLWMGVCMIIILISIFLMYAGLSLFEKEDI